MKTHGPFSSIGIMGLGLMGGSLARSLKSLPDPPFLRGWSRDSHEAQEALNAKVIDEIGPAVVAEGFQDLDLLVYCTPLNTTLSMMEEHGPHLKKGLTVTDVASLKGPVLAAARRAGLAPTFVGSHPMAGGEGSGFYASRDGLFQGATIWLVAGDAPDQATKRIQAFWSGLGGRPALVEAHDHDSLMAWVSQLPQLTANALARVLGEAGVGLEALGPGGRDMVRLAGSSPDMWTDLLEHAPADLLHGLQKLEEKLEEIRTLLGEGRVDDVGGILRQTRDWTREKPWS